MRLYLSPFIILVCLFLPASQTSWAEDVPTLVEPEATIETIEESELHQEIYREESLDHTFELHPEQYYDTFSSTAVPYYLSARGGATYTSGFGSGTDTGGSYGATFILPLVRSLYFYTDGSFNHISGGTQFLGSVGVGKLGLYSHKSIHDRIGWMVSFDQFTDSRVDDLYLANLRALLTYELSPTTTIGMTYSTPLVDDVIDASVFVGGLPNPTTVEAGKYLEAYFSYAYDEMTVSGSVGYRDITEEVTYGLAGSMPLNDRMTMINQARYGSEGNWTVFTGVEFQLSRSQQSTRCTKTGTRPSHAVALASRQALPETVRGDMDLNGDGYVTEAEAEEFRLTTSLLLAVIGDLSSAEIFSLLANGFAGEGDSPVGQDQYSQFVNRNRPVVQQSPQTFYSQINMDFFPLRQVSGQNNNNAANNNMFCRPGEEFRAGGTDINGNPITGSCFDPATNTFRTIP